MQKVPNFASLQQLQFKFYCYLVLFSKKKKASDFGLALRSEKFDHETDWLQRFEGLHNIAQISIHGEFREAHAAELNDWIEDYATDILYSYVISIFIIRAKLECLVYQMSMSKTVEIGDKQEKKQKMEKQISIFDLCRYGWKKQTKAFSHREIRKISKF